MSRVKPSSKEQVIHYLLSNISLGTYDKKFVSNLETGFLGKNKPVTTNQAELLNRIITRYARQLARLEVNYLEFTSLPWTTAPIPSEPEYTTAYAEIVDETIIVKTPYKTSFIKELKSHKNARWEKEKREWHIEFTEPNLKSVVNLIADHYTAINFSEEIKNILSIAETYESVTVWDPTLVNINDNLMIAASNESLHDAISNITLEITPKCISELAMYGISISRDLLNDVSIEFAADINPVINVNSILELVDYLPMIGCEAVVLTSTHAIPKKSLEDLTDGLLHHNIKIHARTSNLLNLKNYVVLYSMFNFNSSVELKAMKLINIINNNPVKIK